MKSKAEIFELKNYLFDLYQNTRVEQAIDDRYYQDTFEVPQIKSIAKLQRLGKGARMVDSPAEHIITSNPQAFRNPTKDNDTKRKEALAVASEVNRWLGVMKRGNPNPPKEFVKNLLLRGEAWIHPLHNERWITTPMRRKGLPVLFTVPDPMIIWPDPNEDEDGVPERVIVYYERMPSIIRARYPGWEGHGKYTYDSHGTKESNINWMEYWDSEEVQFFVNDEEVYQGENIYGFTPFVHKLSGFGKSSPEGKMEDLIVGRLRKIRHVLQRKTALISDIDSIFHLFANRSIDFVHTTPQSILPKDFIQQYEVGPGLAHEIPYGIEPKWAESLMPEPQMFQYLSEIDSELEREDPLVLAGTAVGSTGRQQDMVMGSAMRRYDTLVENTEYAFETAIAMGLEMCEKVPSLNPEEYGLKREDIDGNYEVKVALKAADPIEADRKATLGSRLYQLGQIDMRTNLIKYQGYTEEEAEDIITNMMVDKVTFQSPEIAAVIGYKAAEKMGITDEIEMLRMKAQQQIESQQTLQTMPANSSMMERGQGETGTPLGREMIDQALLNKGARNPPESFTRQG